jgi:hypothetical protein
MLTSSAHARLLFRNGTGQALRQPVIDWNTEKRLPAICMLIGTHSELDL